MTRLGRFSRVQAAQPVLDDRRQIALRFDPGEPVRVVGDRPPVELKRPEHLRDRRARGAHQQFRAGELAAERQPRALLEARVAELVEPEPGPVGVLARGQQPMRRRVLLRAGKLGQVRERVQ